MGAGRGVGGEGGGGAISLPPLSSPAESILREKEVRWGLLERGRSEGLFRHIRFAGEGEKWLGVFPFPLEMKIFDIF